MERIYITRQGVRLRTRDGRLEAFDDDTALAHWPLPRVEAVYAYGNVTFTARAQRQLLRQQARIALFSRRGTLWGLLHPPQDRGLALRQAQHRLDDHDPAPRHEFARAHIAAKLRGSIDVLARRSPRPRPVAAILDELRARVKVVDMSETEDELRAQEAAASQLHFQALGALIDDDRWWAGIRTRRPPRDPFNALLSFGYALLAAEITGLLHAEGFEPGLGHLHKSYRDRAALTFDLMEEFRARSVDAFALRVARQGVLDLDTHFTRHPSQGVRLNPEGMKRFLARWDEEVLADAGDATTTASGHRREWQRHVIRLRDALLKDTAYVTAE